MNLTLSSRTAVILLASLIAARATGYLFSKFCMLELAPLTLLGYRSLLACTVLLPFMISRLKRTTMRDARAGIIIGSLFFLTMVAELMGLLTTDTSVASILENTAIVMVHPHGDPCAKASRRACGRLLASRARRCGMYVVDRCRTQSFLRRMADAARRPPLCDEHRRDITTGTRCRTADGRFSASTDNGRTVDDRCFFVRVAVRSAGSTDL